jgi:methylated-DNA-[protein]-cysteine S-methyltransferase
VVLLSVRLMNHRIPPTIRVMERYGIVDTSWGPLLLVARDGKLIAVVMPSPRRRGFRQIVDRRWPGADHTSSLFPGLQQQIRAYFDGNRVAFDVPLDLSDRTPFQRRILRACLRIPCGRTRTYAQLAATAGYPSAARAVGATMAANPLPLIIPCHRVVRSDGGLGGYSADGGIALKRRLLDLEARTIPPA